VRRLLPFLIAVAIAAAPFAHAASSDLPPCPAYQALLDQNLEVLWANDPSTTPPTRRPVLTTFDYARLALQSDGRAKLDAARKELLEVRVSRLGPAARTAWAINAYNFLVIDGIVQRGFPGGTPVASILDIAGQIPRSLRGGETTDFGFFGAPLATIEGKEYSLNQIERHYLLGDFDSDSLPPPASLDPRIHFALTCGARGGPPIHPRAYRPETLDAQLEDITRGALLGSKHFRWNGMNRELAVSQIFESHPTDFGGPDSAFTFAMRHIPPRTAEQIRTAGITKIPSYIGMDWSLNQTPSR
jgi:hypothetical protein